MQIAVPQILISHYHEADITGKLGLYGEYHIIKRTRGIITQELKFRNLITDQGLRWLAELGTSLSLGDICNYLSLGSGTSTPVTTDTTLQARGFYGKAFTSTKGGQGSGSDYWTELQWELGLTEAIGTWTEIGVGKDSGTPYGVFSRSLFKDEQGNPISIDKTSQDTLTIIYKIHITRSSDAPFSNIVNISGVGDVTVESMVINQGLYGYTNPSVLMADKKDYCFLGANNSAIDPTRTGPSYSLLRNPFMTGASLMNYIAYASPNMYRDVVVEWPASIVGNIGEACILTSGGYNNNANLFFRFNPVIPKDNTKKFRLGVRMTFNRIA